MKNQFTLETPGGFLSRWKVGNGTFYEEMRLSYRGKRVNSISGENIIKRPIFTCLAQHQHCPPDASNAEPLNPEPI
jgi:hypothetical protein